MNIDAKKLDSAVVLTVTGRMDADNADQFDRACQQWIDKGTSRIIADVSGLTYVSSMGLRSFLSAAKAAQVKNGALILVGLQGLPRQVFEMTRLIGLFQVYETKEAAVASL